LFRRAAAFHPGARHPAATGHGRHDGRIVSRPPRSGW
jgi:hypothetical protein